MMKTSRRLLVSLISTGVYFLAIQLVRSILARYSRDLGIDVASTGFIWSLVYLVAFFMRPVAGYIADRTSSYLAMSLGSLFMVAASVTYLFSTGFKDLVIGRILHGIGSAYFISPSIAAVATAAGEKAGMALGVRSMLISLTSIAAPPAAGFIVDSVGYALVFIVAAALAAFVALFNAIEARRSRVGITASRHRAGWREALNKLVVMIAIVALFNGILFLTVSGILQAHYRDLGYEAKLYGYFLMFFGISSIFSRYMAGKLSTNRNPAIIALVGHIITATSVIMLRTMYLVPLSYIVALVYGFGIGLTIPTQQLIVSYAVPQEVRNRAISIYAMGFDLGGFIGPMVFGYIASVQGYEFSYQYLVISPVIAAVLMAYVALKMIGPELKYRKN